MAMVKIIITEEGGTVLDEFTVFRRGRPYSVFSSPAITQYTPALLQQDIREYIEHRFEVEDSND